MRTEDEIRRRLMEIAHDERLKPGSFQHADLRDEAGRATQLIQMEGVSAVETLAWVLEIVELTNTCGTCAPHFASAETGD